MTQDTSKETSTKRCACCGEYKSLTSFYRHPGTRDGYRNKCKSCLNAASMEWARRNPEKRAKIRQKFLETHVEHLHAYEAERWKTDRDAIAERTRRWRQSHPLERAQNEAKRRAKLKGCDVDTVDYTAILERDGWRCYLCDGEVTPETLSFDHVIPIGKGGPHTNENIKVTHRSCNSRKGQRLLSIAT